MRLASANAYDSTVSTLADIQSAYAAQVDRVSSGKRVLKASDDPIAAASAERAMSRISQLQAEQRALNVQKDGLATAESTLGDAGTLLNRFRELAVSAGNASNNATDRTSIAGEMQSIRDQVFSLANTRDSNGIYLFSGLESGKVQGVTTPAFTTSGAPPALQYQFNGTPGQNLPTQGSVPFTLDGNAAWMQVPKGNGVYDVTLGATNTGKIATDMGQFSTTPTGGALTNSYQISFTVNPTTPATTTYNVVDPTAPAVNIATGTYVEGQPIAFTDATPVPAVNVTLTVNGVPATGDTVDIAPYTIATGANPANASLFELMDKAITGISNNASSSPMIDQTIAQTLDRIDAGMSKLETTRAQAGVWLSRADTVTSANDGQAIQLETDRSNAQDLDMVAGTAQQQKLSTGYQIALQSYASIHKLSLFDYIR